MQPEGVLEYSSSTVQEGVLCKSEYCEIQGIAKGKAEQTCLQSSLLGVDVVDNRTGRKTVEDKLPSEYPKKMALNLLEGLIL